MKFFQLVPENTNLDFIGKFKYFFALSLIILAVTIAAMVTKGFNYGIDFTGGTVLQVKFASATPIDEIRKQLTAIGVNDSTVQELGKSETEYLITNRVADESHKMVNIDTLLQEKFGKDQMTVMQKDSVGPKVGKELRTAAAMSLFYSVILIMVYIWFRFDFRFAPGATVAMVHDLTVVAGFYLLTGKEFTITAVAALLTIAGYSVNDTIVVYDRVREIMKGSKDDVPLGPTINKAVNLTLSRTLLTSFVTLLSIVPVAVMCKGEIHDFAVAMIVGIFVGTYSTIYIASPLTVYVQKLALQTKNKR